MPDTINLPQNTRLSVPYDLGKYLSYSANGRSIKLPSKYLSLYL